MNRRTAALAVAAALLAAGCTAPAATRADGTIRPTAPAHSGQSLWHVIDDSGRTANQLADDDPLVTAVRKTVVLHSGILDNRDHRTIGDSATAEFAFYSEEFADTLRAQQYPSKLRDLFTENGLSTRQTAVAWYRSTFPTGRDTAKVEMETTIEFTTADPAYLKAHGFSLRTPYTQHRTVSLAKIDGRWLIVALTKNPLTRQAKTLPQGTG